MTDSTDCSREHCSLLIAQTQYQSKTGRDDADFDEADADIRAEEMAHAESLIEALEKAGYLKF